MKSKTKPKPSIKEPDKKQDQIKVYICPNCKSLKVGYEFRLKNLFGLMPRMRCKKCGYEAPIFPLLYIDKSKINKKEKRGKKK